MTMLDGNVIPEQLNAIAACELANIATKIANRMEWGIEKVLSACADGAMGLDRSSIFNGQR
jgi:hypothetical protein